MDADFSSEQIAQMDSMLEAADGPPEGAEEFVEENLSAEEGSQSTEPKERVETTEVEAKPRKRELNYIPHTRFNEVNEARKEALKQLEAERMYFREQQAEYERQLADFKAQQSRGQRNQAEDEFAFLDDNKQGVQGLSRDDVLALVREESEPFQLHFAEVQLKSEIAEAMERYPGVSEDILLNAVASEETGFASVDEIARGIHLWQEEVRQDAIRQYLEEHPTSALADEQEVPRPDELGSRADSPASKVHLEEDEAKDLDPIERGTARAMKWLKQTGKSLFD